MFSCERREVKAPIDSRLAAAAFGLVYLKRLEITHVRKQFSENLLQLQINNKASESG